MLVSMGPKGRNGDIDARFFALFLCGRASERREEEDQQRDKYQKQNDGKKKVSFIYGKITNECNIQNIY